MERAPLPPHERTWRHPSELGPTHLEVETHGHGRVAILATGTLAVVLVAALVVSMTPRRSSNPLAVSATTAPSSAQTIRAATSTAAVEPSNQVLSVRSAGLTSFNAIPNAIAAVPNAIAPAATAKNSSSAILPELTDEVLVLTDHVAYAVAWSDVALLSLPDDTIVVAADGSIVARFTEGRLVVTADAVVGAAIAIDDD